MFRAMSDVVSDQKWLYEYQATEATIPVSEKDRWSYYSSTERLSSWHVPMAEYQVSDFEISRSMLESSPNRHSHFFNFSCINFIVWRIESDESSHMLLNVKRQNQNHYLYSGSYMHDLNIDKTCALLIHHECELAGVVRYTTTLLWSLVYQIPIVQFMEAQANESLVHAQQVGEILTGLNGHPTDRTHRRKPPTFHQSDLARKPRARASRT